MSMYMRQHDSGGWGYGFLHDGIQFFRPDQKQNVFVSAVQHKTFDFFAIYFSFDFQHTILNSQGVITFTLTLYLYFL